MVAALGLTLNWSLDISRAQESDTRLIITESCGDKECPEPRLQGDRYIISSGHKDGDTISLDIRIKNPKQQTITSAQTWLTYNTQHLEGLNIQTYENFDLAAPGEKEFDTENGRAKIGVASTKGGVSDPEIVVATVSFKVITKQTAGSFVEFYDHRLNELGHTNVNSIQDGFPVNILTEAPKPTRISLNGTGGAGGPATPPPVVAPTTPEPVVTLARPTGLQIDTGDGYVYLRWNRDPTSLLGGYNIYYSMTSGRYLHRKQVGLVDEFYITGLNNGETYFFAITALDTAGNESDYSDEVAITVGYPETSTSPIGGIHRQPIIRGNTDTGPASTAILLIAIMAGTVGLYMSNRRKSAYLSSLSRK